MVAINIEKMEPRFIKINRMIADGKAYSFTHLAEEMSDDEIRYAIKMTNMPQWAVDQVINDELRKKRKITRIEKWGEDAFKVNIVKSEGGINLLTDVMAYDPNTVHIYFGASKLINPHVYMGGKVLIAR